MSRPPIPGPLNAVAPAIVLQPKSGTNFGGETINLISLANGQGLANLTFNGMWTANIPIRKDTNVFADRGSR
jgi:hypothetical protein